MITGRDTLQEINDYVLQAQSKIESADREMDKLTSRLGRLRLEKAEQDARTRRAKEKEKEKMEKTSKKTLLHGWHVSHGANMADFGGYEMPLWYSTAKAEHLAVLTKAGIFDTSHMAVVTVTGPQAFELLQLCFTNDLAACTGKNNINFIGDGSFYQI